MNLINLPPGAPYPMRASGEPQGADRTNTCDSAASCSICQLQGMGWRGSESSVRHEMSPQSVSGAETERRGPSYLRFNGLSTEHL
eukprot:scaffold1381_cov386-Prasinococcus_capsulatus_cf.AAC.19